MTQPGGDAHAWLEGNAIRRASDVALGVMALVVGTYALAYAPDVGRGWSRLGPGSFPSVVATLLCVVAVLLLLRAARRRSPPVRRSRLLYVAIIATVFVGFVFAIRRWGDLLFLQFGPSEITAFVFLELAVVIALAHTSRTRAVGMALLGLLLSTVGTDVNSGIARFTMGVEALMDGISVAAVLLGLLIVADTFVCLASPLLFLQTYTRLIATWRTPRIPAFAAGAMRVAAALVIPGACYYTYTLQHSAVDVASILVFGVFGAAAKIFGWNRYVLYMGFALGPLLEENIRRSMLLARGDPSVFFQRPISGALLFAAAAVLIAAVLQSVRRASIGRRPSPV